MLQEVHARYFAALDSNAAAAAASTRGSVGPEPRTDALISDVMGEILDGVCVCFSGVFPLNCAATKTPLWRRCLAFGAAMADGVAAREATAPAPSFPTTGASLSVGGRPPGAAGLQQQGKGAGAAPLVTHLVARRPGTSKFNDALAAGDVRVVHFSWLEETLKR